jgi:ferric-dicitrate binding protein FerR (iron transport regulator)
MSTRAGEDLDRDPALEHVLRVLAPAAAEPDWDAWTERLHERARLPLARRRRRLPALAGWTSAAAACVLVLFGAWNVGRAGARSAPGDVPGITAEEALTADLTEMEFVLIVSGLSDPDGLLTLAVQDP